ncbi:MULTISPECIES: preprotein translocase subunit SecG [Acinetobacter]|uniref:Protein-export membrane protein SecG n=3 Tax=Acinetobacter haemolyticus TaxID=29430 RepID=A0A1L6KR03_ACIHA|nr:MULTISPECIES: preprotein translocase subunit SecG [Acinetobacter]APR71499.1 preprotein translocase subunit SecG [Acinetobacter haemolyticus]ATZ68350.1 preprotein translocase subunit SecG [Acinetobacter haemolyticus]AZN67479.1 preprotein translocase subunit SecG [Acinetobacter haemolyticus]EEH69749.1 preprotein translocase, SecG subunit [Acinetobacter sp. ATCC 27244]EFF83786.1 preprotein translocase, SecG subunit [Acinetobacter haemolyticus ATCC 19194]
MYSFILVVHIILAILIIALVLVQQGKGAEAGASFGGGGAATVFGASGAGNFLTRLTAIFTAIFFVTSLSLAVMAKKSTTDAYSLKTVQSSSSVPAASTETSSNAPKTTE